MSLLLKHLNRRARRLARLVTSPRRLLYPHFRNDPAGYAKAVLGITITPEIEAALLGLLHYPHRVSVDSGHGVGKTFGAALAVNWWYDTRDPCWIITTAPTERDVKDLLWTEIRLQRSRAVLPISNDLQPAAPEMFSGPEHVAKGYTARDANSAQGRHRRNMLFIFDEKEGVQKAFWDGARSMFRPDAGDAWLVIGNPVTTSSTAYQEHRATDGEGNPSWHRVRISSLNHPNIAAGLAGLPLPVPGAVTVGQMDGWVSDWADPLPTGEDRQPSDFEWRGRWFRPGPIGEPRILGLRPSAGTFGVWSPALWAMTLAEAPPILAGALPVIGCDVANYGTDYTVFHVRCGPVSLYHQAVNGWGADRVHAELMRLAAEWAEWSSARQDRQAARITPQQIPIQIDDDATGRAISSFLLNKKYSVRPVNAGGTPQRPDLYTNNRSELWFQCAKRAGKGQVNLSRLPKSIQQKIELEATAPTWWPDDAGHRVVESKDDLRDPKRLGRSPDNMDAVNLAYYETAAATYHAIDPRAAPQEQPRATANPWGASGQGGHFGSRR